MYNTINIYELLERLSETDSMLLALDRQLESWGHRAVVNVNGCRKRNAKYLENEQCS